MRKLRKTLGRRKATIKTGKHPVPNNKISVHGFGQKIKKLKKKGIICVANTLHFGSAQNFNQPFPGSPLSLNVSVSQIMARLRFVFFYFKICYPSQFSLALQFQTSVLEISYKILNF